MEGLEIICGDWRRKGEITEEEEEEEWRSPFALSKYIPVGKSGARETSVDARRVDQPPRWSRSVASNAEKVKLGSLRV